MSRQVKELNHLSRTQNMPSLLKYMTPVKANQEKLNDLTKNWDTLSLLSKLGDAGVNMDEIKVISPHFQKSLLKTLLTRS